MLFYCYFFFFFFVVAFFLFLVSMMLLHAHVFVLQGAQRIAFWVVSLLALSSRRQSSGFAEAQRSRRAHREMTRHWYADAHGAAPCIALP